MQTDKRKYQRVVAYIKNEVAKRRLKPGDRLPTERDLSVKLHLGRATVREALRRLEILGLLESRQGSGAYLTCHFDAAYADAIGFAILLGAVSFSEISFMRYSLGLIAYRLAFYAATEEELNLMETSLQRLHRSRSDSRRVARNIEYHRLFVVAANNRLLTIIYDGLSPVFAALIRAAIAQFREEDVEKLRSAHDRILTSLRKRDFTQGVCAIDEHYAILSKYFSSTEDLHFQRAWATQLEPLADCFISKPDAFDPAGQNGADPLLGDID